ncbi:MAG: DEAD/DEAH box helicase, partial [Deltaproteobacteria bacterium]|nr:DEAD/DEAH box helicase [Deltaproteobacteria bacterium]
SRKYAEERWLLRREYEEKVQAGILPQQETKMPLFSYQRAGMLHLAFKERALLADEMGLGKTIQAIAACALLRRLGKVRRVLIISPASLKTEWEEQIRKFSDLPYQIVFGPRHKRLQAYAGAPFFTIVNYEQMLRDSLEVNARLAPDVVILDEAQRIKNWSTKTAQAIKRLQSRYAFVLTGTPIENRIDEIYSIVNFIDPAVLGPLFRFNREFYELDDRGRPIGYRNLDKLHERIRPLMIRRRKAHVETQLPSRTDRNHFVRMSPGQLEAYRDHETNVARLVSVAKRRSLTRQEQNKLMRELAMMRMVCDTPYILDPKDRSCPKLKELESLLDELCSDREVKVVIFSEWVRMLDLVRELIEKMKFGYALHTGNVPQRRRRGEILMFKSDPDCRVFLSTDSGGLGLNLQNASIVINCDLPWNPAKLEQRIARVWRKYQMRNVTVINLISENTIEQRMLETLAVKRSLAEGVLDRKGDLTRIPLKRGARAFMDRLEQVVKAPVPPAPVKPHPEALPADRSAGFAARASELLGERLVACEERYPEDAAHSVITVVVERDAQTWQEKLQPVHEALFGKDKIDPLSPVHFQVIDRATVEAMDRLARTGLLKTTVRATRHLYPEPERGGHDLTGEERQQIADLRKQGTRKLKMARILDVEDLGEESREALLKAINLLGRALAVEHHLPEPKDATEALSGPLASLWNNALSTLREFIGKAETPVPLALDAIRSAGPANGADFFDRGNSTTP